jgi:hypothetical protein
VLAAPATYPEHSRRIRDADLSFPLHVVRRRQRWLVMDGIHRLARADFDGVPTVAVHIVTPAVLRLVLVPV